jgi:hypothetical protein
MRCRLPARTKHAHFRVLSVGTGPVGFRYTYPHSPPVHSHLHLLTRLTCPARFARANVARRSVPDALTTLRVTEFCSTHIAVEDAAIGTAVSRTAVAQILVVGRHAHTALSLARVAGTVIDGD